MLRRTFLKQKLKFKSANYSNQLMISSIPEDDINQVLSAETPYEFRKSKFDSIIFFLMNTHSKELLEYSKELRKTEKEKAEIKDELHGVEKELLKVKFTVEKLTVDLLQSRGKLNVRGALEYCRAYILGSVVSYSFEEPVNKTLKKLEENATFIEILKKKCKENKMREKDVILCLGGLYHNASKEFHGHNFDAVEIVKKSWTENEIIALASIFEHCKVRYVVLDEFGQPLNPCP